MSAYAPKTGATICKEKAFWEDLRNFLKNIPKEEIVHLGGAHMVIARSYGESCPRTAYDEGLALKTTLQLTDDGLKETLKKLVSMQIWYKIVVNGKQRQEGPRS
ncbi:hypothetical protein EVAR_35512_1 [Eumeta japonica]|uniref:Uncharacterized protein n=1 Tax=Eumeta variegata TaxID=151549 RepID=A0A4C1X6E3_EUMVA|nr:hypothetical protein EVAR_35512_1 [Eumeta japonica]